MSSHKPYAVLGEWYDAKIELPSNKSVIDYYIDTHCYPEFIVLLKGAFAPTVLHFDGTNWWDRETNTIYNNFVEYWQMLPYKLPYDHIVSDCHKKLMIKDNTNLYSPTMKFTVTSVSK